ncbi:MAG: chromate transporter [Candidatus Avelusimicrobium sp.]|uniref:chromate transporter n=1 Tax=Candidatus Avelusimicrobium sp. TaxID=3048833 RepID=UPI003F0209FE
MIYLKLFFTFFKIGLFNFGGGYAMISFIQNEVVFKNVWLTSGEFTDIVAVSQVTPGPIGINLATYTGYTAAGNFWGSAVATFAVCLPSFLLMLLASRYFLKHQHARPVEAVFAGLRPAVVGLIAAAALVLCNAENFADWKSLVLCAGAFMAVWKFKTGPITAILCAGILGLVLY